VDVVRDVLDKKVVDRNGREMGRVDSLILELEEGRPPALGAIEIGPAVLAYRVLPALGRWVSAIERGFNVDQGRPLRIPFRRLDIDRHIRADVAVGETSAATVEQRLRRWVGAIPGSS